MLTTGGTVNQGQPIYIDNKKEESILKEAERLVNGPRQNDYGHPHDDYSKVGKIWSGILRDILKPGCEVTALQAALCMIGVKLSREANRHKRDNLVDAAGYAQVADMIAKRAEELTYVGKALDPNYVINVPHIVSVPPVWTQWGTVTNKDVPGTYTAEGCTCGCCEDTPDLKSRG